MYGSVTDAQVFSRALSVKEMKDYTLCKGSFSGDLITWDREPWVLKSPLQTSEVEMLDFERDVCHSPDNGLFLVPHKFTYEDSIHTCRKLSGSLITYTNKTDFDDIIYHLSLRNNMKTKGCVDVGEDSTNLVVWAGGLDDITEGTFETWNKRELIKVGLIKS